MSDYGGSDMNAELENLLAADPIASHAKIMQMTRPPPVIIHKEYTGPQPSRSVADNGDPLVNDDLIDALAAALADIRGEFQDLIDDRMANLTEQVAVLQGQVGTLLSVIGSIVSNNNGNGNNSKSIEASEVKTTRRVRVRRTSEIAS